MDETMKTITISAEEERVLRNLLDGATRHFGSAAAEAVVVFLRKLDTATNETHTNVVGIAAKAASGS